MARIIPTRAHLDDQLVAEAFLTEGEDVRESLNSVIEKELYELGLHLWTQLLIEVKLLNNHVVVVIERFNHTFLDSLSHASRHGFKKKVHL